MRQTFIVSCFFGLILLFASCDFITPPQQKNAPASTADIINTDRQFAQRSLEVGMRKAYFEYMSNDVVLLRPGTKPVKGAQAVEFMSLVNDEDYTLTWQPIDATISNSGDLGFSYGIYELTDGTNTYEGTYVNIWKKQTDGSWKFVLNAGNEGISPNAR